MKQFDWNSSVDYVDQNTRYMDILNQHPRQIQFFENWTEYVIRSVKHYCSNYIIPNGKIIYAGVWKGEIYRVFQTLYEDRVMGFDIEKYANDTDVIYGDFRKISKRYQQPCAIFFNGLGHWARNKKSKQAGLKFAVDNLVEGGLYFDNYHGTPFKTLHPQLKYIDTYRDKHTNTNSVGIILFKKINPELVS